jgi:hypothetical protein
MNAQSSGSSGSPYSAIHDAPARRWLYRPMSRRGAWHTTAPNSSGVRTYMFPTNSPPLLPPMMPSSPGVVTDVATRSRPTASKSS